MLKERPQSGQTNKMGKTQLLSQIENHGMIYHKE